MKKIWKRGLILVSALITIVGFMAIGIWYVPGRDRLSPAQEAQWHALTLPPAYLEYVCGGSYTPEDRKTCEADTRKYAPDYAFDLLYPQAIPLDDCALMAQALYDGLGARDDGRLYLNVNGGTNCYASEQGLIHVAEPTSDEGILYTDPLILSQERRLSPEASVFAYRTAYVTRPQYSLFRTRAVLETGHLNEGGSGSICIYSHLSGQWRLEGECLMSWIS
ncbi:MAG: hypothetical protein QM667_11170 [Asticcacaulis sp.]